MEDERWLIISVVEHLKRVQRDGELVRKGSLLQTAMDALMQAYDLDANELDAQQQQQQQLSLMDVLRTGREQLLGNDGEEAPVIGSDIRFERFLGRLRSRTQLGETAHGRKLAYRKYKSRSGEALRISGNSAMSRGEYEIADRLYGNAISFTCDRATLWSNRAAARVHLGRFEAAIADCRRAIALDGTYMRARERLANLFHTLHRYKDELHLLEDSLAIAPCNEQLAARLAAVREHVRDPSTATRP